MLENHLYSGAGFADCEREECDCPLCGAAFFPLQGQRICAGCAQEEVASIYEAV